MNGPSRHRSAGVIAGVALLAMGGPGLAGHGADKTGSDTVVLHLATIDGSVNANGQEYGPQAFVDSLDSVSGGRLQVEVSTSYGDGAADAESRLVEAIASGDLDGGWPSTRAFAGAGIDGLQAIEAPMTITSYAAEKALVTSPIADTVRERLAGSGVVGLGLAVGPLRRPFATAAPLLGPADWDGERFRVFNSPVQADVVTAIGGEPANLGFDWIDEANAGTLRGAEFDIAQYSANGLTTEVGFVTANVVLWPKVFVLAMSQERFDALTDEQREWVTQAAALATQASVDADYDETTLARELCDKGARFVSADAEEIDALHAAVAPVVDQLAADPHEGPLLADVRAVAEGHPDPDVPDVPASCQQAGSAPADASTIPDEPSALPDGTYRVEITASDGERAGLNNPVGWAGTWTLEVKEGTYAVTCRALDDAQRNCGGSNGYEGALEAGDLHGTDNIAYFVYNPELLAQLTGCLLPVSSDTDHCGPNPSYSMTWALDGDSLTFGEDVKSPAGWIIEPWQRIG